MSDDDRAAQVTGLKRRIAILEAHNAKLVAAVQFTNKTLALCRDPNENPLAKMIDRQRAEDMLRDAAAVPELPKEIA